MPPVKIKEKGVPLRKKMLAHLPVLEAKPTIIPIVVRRDIETNQPCLFFMNGDGTRRWLMGYAHVGQHFEPDWHYYHHGTKAASIEEPEVASLVREWANQPPLDQYEVHTGFPPFGRKLT